MPDVTGDVLRRVPHFAERAAHERGEGMAEAAQRAERLARDAAEPADQRIGAADRLADRVLPGAVPAGRDVVADLVERVGGAVPQLVPFLVDRMRRMLDDYGHGV